MDDDSKITLDVLMCQSHKMSPYNVSIDGLLNLERYRDINAFTNSNDDLYSFMRAFPKVNFRYYVWPSTSLKESELNVDNATSTYPMQMQGRKDGANAVKMAGEGHMF